MSAKETKPLEQKADSIKNFPIPKTVKELRRFSGMINFYRRFIPDAARIQAQPNALLTGLIKNSHSVNIIGETPKAFNICNESLCHASLLAHLDCDAKLVLSLMLQTHLWKQYFNNINAGFGSPSHFTPINLVRHSEIIPPAIANS
ncbi:hypothetical protein EVAR_21212_1 [Eumeta japonica]|uniref:Retrovirus-related Pol polyprotein from transposon opus n=1 Tax=Eumeta variegata TaxID=151549 RepID=A0A4C1UNR1_EUMVA|nr:hypothetical protein EVAR_21212_1 [Eumeta japonica]